MKKIFFTALLGFLSLFIFLSCNQDPIFWLISLEREELPPRIPGSPTNMVVVPHKPDCPTSCAIDCNKKYLFVATRFGRDIQRYSNGNWSTIARPGEAIGELATDGNHLYALTFPGGDPWSQGIIRKFDGNAWHDVVTSAASDYSIQKIYGVNGYIFAAGARRSDNSVHYTVFYIDTGNTPLQLRPLDGISAPLSGAVRVGNTIYLATMHMSATAAGGIFSVTAPGPGALPPAVLVGGTADFNITGIIGFEDNGAWSVIAVSNEPAHNQGYLFIKNDSDSDFSYLSTSHNFTGALAIWKHFVEGEGWVPGLVLLGARDHRPNREQGYREMVITGAAGARRPATATLGGVRGRPADYPSSVANRARYTANLGRYPVHSLIQVPHGVIQYPDMTDPDFENWEPPIFAGTSRRGLWAYRNNNWNTED